MSSQRATVMTKMESPSHRTTEHGNPAVFKPRWFVLDDINVEIISAGAVAATVVAWLTSSISVKEALAGLLATVIPLRLFLPRPNPPRGTVLITGASSGIGAELSYIFADKGHDLVLVGRNHEQLQAVKRNVEQKYGTRAQTIVSDLSVPGAPQKLYNEVTIECGIDIDILVNGAGLGGAGDTLEQPVELVESMTTLNCISLVQLTQLFGRGMVKRGHGWILQISSVGGWMASPGQTLYHATKHYVRAFSEALSVELRAYPGIVNTQLMPGPTHTQFVTRAHAEETFTMAASGAVEDPKAVAIAGYNVFTSQYRA
ncbi:hypothetical protein N7524_001005 [Penicillium chrysogenum]|nr:hypothetical protein N7524_001005 [Penicillium chrysogenum]